MSDLNPYAPSREAPLPDAVDDDAISPTQRVIGCVCVALIVLPITISLFATIIMVILRVAIS